MAQAIITPSRQLIVGPRGFRKPARPVLDLADPINRGGLIGRWLLGDGSGNTLYRDISGNGIQLTGQNSPTLDSSHHGGMSNAFLNANNTRIVSAATVPLANQTYSIAISLWAKASSFVQLGTLLKNNGHYVLRSDNFFGPLQIVFNWFDGSNIRYVTAPLPSTNVWHHYVAIAKNNDASAIYIDGVLASGAAATWFALARSDGLLAISSSDTGESWNGSIDDVFLRINPFSVSEISRLYAEPCAGIYEAGPRWRVGAAAAGGATRPVKMVGRWGGYAGASGGFAG